MNPGDTIEVTGPASLSNSFLGDTIQVCVVTRDLRRTLDGFVQLGIGPWRVYTFSPETVKHQTYGGTAQPYSMRLALANSGTMMWEVIQPLEGPSIYKDFLARHGEGVQHVGRPATDWISMRSARASSASAASACNRASGRACVTPTTAPRT
jgi:methylmalonyl-CoA/ethylmalonyl-CoA epimerase